MYYLVFIVCFFLLLLPFLELLKLKYSTVPSFKPINVSNGKV